MVYELIIIPILLFFFLCWGSFLNILAYRFINGISLFAPSHCPHCRNHLAWHDNIPLVSYFRLSAQCRTCQRSISWLYPATELLTAILLTTLYIKHDYFWGYFILFSALIVTIRSDLETMLISRYVTLALVPIGILFSFIDLIPIHPLNSILGAGFGYGFLWLIASMFAWATHKEGMGEGDFDLMALIGSFTGVLGAWSSLLIGSLCGSIFGIALILSSTHTRNTKIPFGPFLAFGTIIYVFLQDWLTLLIVG